MAAYSCIARWLLDEASSGTTPTTIADDESTNDLTISYDGSNSNWTSVAAGNGWEVTSTTAAAIAELSDIATNGNIGSSLASVTEASVIMAVRIDGGTTNWPRMFAIQTDSGDGDLSIVHDNLDDSESFKVRWNDDNASGGLATFPSIQGSGGAKGFVVVVVVVDTTQATAADRVKVWYDGVSQTQGTITISQNSNLQSVNSTNRNMSLMNRGSLTRSTDGVMYYAEIGNGQLTTGQISTIQTALESDNDANWNGAAPATTPKGPLSHPFYGPFRGPIS
jgi:hypothetical protein